MRSVVCSLSALLVLAACETRRPTTETPATPVPDAAPIAAPDTADFSSTHYDLTDGRDTTFLIGGRPYRLLLRADIDSTRPLRIATGPVVGPAFTTDSTSAGQVQGYEGGHTITLLDPQGRRVFRRRLRNQDFFGVASPDIVTVSDPLRPRFFGYHAPSQTLLFRLDIAIPGSDVWQQCAIVLGLDGRLRYLAPVFDSNWDAADCVPRLLPDGTVLSCQELLRPDARRISLLRPKANLMAAFPINDSLLLTMYQYGEYRQPPPEPAPDTATGPEIAPIDGPISAGFNYPEWVPDKRMRHAPNAFVVNTQGQVRQRLRFTNFDGGISTEIARRYLWQTHRYYLLDDDGLLVINKQQPTSPVRVRWAQMQRFRKPQRPAEVRFYLFSIATQGFAFYVDPARPTQLRYQRID